MSARSDYIEQYAAYAMEQMKLYGIPASVILAQAIIESGNGQSRLAVNENNHFGIKASQAWIDGGGQYALYSDDRPNEKFCKYGTVGDSYTHHSQVLMGSRYSACHALAADDYRGWAQGLQDAGYATSRQYASTLVSVIESNDLQKYDRIVMEQQHSAYVPQGLGNAAGVAGNYSFPLNREEFLFINSPYGNRIDPMDPTKTQFHKGIDISCNNEAVMATEDNGKVVSLCQDANTAGGKSVTVEYRRQDGTSYKVSYFHLSSIAVNVGDTVNAAQQIGVSGNTGRRSTGPHLHFSVKQVSRDGTERSIDPASYLAEIAQRGNIGITAMYNGRDLLEKYKLENPLVPDTPLLAQRDAGNPLGVNTDMGPDDWMKKLLSSEDSGISLGGQGDPIVDFIVTAFTSLMAFAFAIDGISGDDAMEAATTAAMSRSVDLSSLMPSARECRMTIAEGESFPTLHIYDGTNRYAIRLTQSDVAYLQRMIADSGISDAEKEQSVSGYLTGLMSRQQLALNYEIADASCQLSRALR